MNCLVPLNTAADTSAPPVITPQDYTLSQTLASGADSATFDLSAFNFSQPPSNIVPIIVRASGASSGLTAFPRQWTATSFTCDLSAPTSDGTFVCTIQIFP